MGTARKLLAVVVVLAFVPLCAHAACGTVEFVGEALHSGHGRPRVRVPIFVYRVGGERAVVVKQDMRVNADGAPRAYALDDHGLSYLCDGLTWKSASGFTNRPPCGSKIREAVGSAQRDGEWLVFSEIGPTVCVFGFHVEDGVELAGCSGSVVGGGIGGRARVKDIVTSRGEHAYFVSTTSIHDTDPELDLAEQQIDASRIPFIVRPGRWTTNHPRAAFGLGDYAYVYSPGSVGVREEAQEGPRGTFAIVADTGPATQIGEGSIALHQLLAFGELRPAPEYVPSPGRSHPEAERIFHPYVDKRDGDIRAKANIEAELWYVIFPESVDEDAGKHHAYSVHGAAITGNVHVNGVRAADAMGGIGTLIDCLASNPVFRSKQRIQE